VQAARQQKDAIREAASVLQNRINLTSSMVYAASYTRFILEGLNREKLKKLHDSWKMQRK
jgi:hypothetical protein